MDARKRLLTGCGGDIVITLPVSARTSIMDVSRWAVGLILKLYFTSLHSILLHFHFTSENLKRIPLLGSIESYNFTPTWSHAYALAYFLSREPFLCIKWRRVLTYSKGAVLSEPPTSDDPKTFKFAGSTIVLVAESREEVIKILKDDVYAQKGVWDVDNVSFIPLSSVHSASFWKPTQ